MAAKHVKPNDDLVIDANVYNAAVDLYLQKNGQQPRGAFRPEGEQQTRVVVRNVTGNDWAAYTPIAFGSPLVLPSDDLEGFHNRIVLQGNITPDSGNYRWGITQEAIASGDFGEAAASGLSYVQAVAYKGMTASLIQFLAPNGSHPSGTPQTLIPTVCGICRVIWIDDSAAPTGSYGADTVCWAIVNLG